MKTKKKIIAALLISGAIFSPVTAYAWGAIGWLQPAHIQELALWAANKAEELGQMAANQASKLAQLAKTEASTLVSYQNTTSEITATIEKETGAQKELAQSELNYTASKITTSGAAVSLDKFGSESEIIRMCDTSLTGTSIARGSASSSISGKSLGSAYLRRDLYTKNRGVAQKELLSTHSNNYCSDVDKSRGRCEIVSDTTMQNADISASSLLNPSNGATYSAQESKAAQDFIKIVGNATPSELLPTSVERTSQGSSYLIEGRKASSQMSVVLHSLTQIWSERSPDSLAIQNSTDPAGSVSILGMMRKFVYDRFADPKWKADLAGMDLNGTLREIAVILAGKNFTAYQSYQQQQRMDAILATDLAISSFDSNSTRLMDIKSKLSTSHN